MASEFSLNTSTPSHNELQVDMKNHKMASERILPTTTPSRKKLRDSTKKNGTQTHSYSYPPTHKKNSGSAQKLKKETKQMVIKPTLTPNEILIHYDSKKWPSNPLILALRPLRYLERYPKVSIHNLFCILICRQLGHVRT